jgi:uncharacterized protein (DUF1501 family)
MANIITRRSFMKASFQATVGLGLASLMNIPPFLKRALAEGSIGVNGKKLLFIFLRGGNDGVNNVIPIMDPSYRGTLDGGTGVYANRNVLGLPKHPAGDSLYQDTSGPGACPGLDPQNPGAAIPLCNGFAALNPALADLVPLYNAGDLALLHRVGYRSLSRSHFDSEKYWEKAADGTSANRLISDGIWYRTIVESGWNLNHALSGVSIQSNMPQSLRGKQPMTNLSSLGRYNLLGIYAPSGSTNTDRLKVLGAIDAANQQPYPVKDNRDLVYKLGTQFRDTLDIFQASNPNPALDFGRNELYDTDGLTHLFPINAGSDQRGLGSGAYGFMQNIKSCAQILANTDAIICGTQLDGFDTHTGQVTAGSPHLGGHANLLRRIAWAYYALWRFFSNPAYNLQGRNLWDDVIVVTMSEFGRTSAENASIGTDHGESSVMYVAGGGVNGNVYGCDLQTNSILGGPNWAIGTGAKDGTLFSIGDRNVGYINRTIDYRSVLGEIIRDHLDATQNQLNRIIPAYANESVERLKNGGPVGTATGTKILGEVGIV